MRRTERETVVGSWCTATKSGEHGEVNTFHIIVPALNLPADRSDPTQQAARRYAEMARASRIDRFLLNGSTTRGDMLTAEERAAVLDLWIEVVGADRLMTCCWNAKDIAVAQNRRVTPMAVMHNVGSVAEALAFLSRCPPDAFIYSHPMFGQHLTPEIAANAAQRDQLPAGGKLAKVSLAEIAEIGRHAPRFAVLDGSSRQIRASLGAGASGIVATPLAGNFGRNLPPGADLDDLQRAADDVQSELDRLPDRPARHRFLAEQAVRSACDKGWTTPVKTGQKRPNETC